MKPQLSTIVRLTLDGCSIFFIIIILLVLGIRYTAPVHSAQERGARPSVREPNLGGSVKFADIDFAKNRATLIMVLQNDCVRSDQVTSFYRELLSQETNTFKAVP